MTTEHSSTPNISQLQSVQKAMTLPTVGAAVTQLGAIYSKVKGINSLLDWALSTAEAGVVQAATKAAPYVEAPIAVGDAALAAAVDELKRRVPLVTEEPKVIVETTKQAVLSKIPTSSLVKVYHTRIAAEQRVHSLKELSWAKANALLSTTCGQKAVQGVDQGAMYAMQLLDHYLPPVGIHEETSQEIEAVSDNQALHTVQTLGRLSAVTVQRVFSNFVYQVEELRTIGIEQYVRRYTAALLTALHLAKITSEQQQRQAEEQNTPQDSEPTAHVTSPPKTSNGTTPTTVNQVKSTLESSENPN